MPLQATSGAASYDGFGGGVAVEPVYIEQIFSTYLYTGNGSTQTITNGIDLAGKGGMVWQKVRTDSGSSCQMFDTARGIYQRLSTAQTNAQLSWSPYGVTAFGSTGFTIADTSGGDYGCNGSPGGTYAGNGTYVSWTFRKQPKFFDIVTYTGNGTNGRAISHSLGSAPGCIIVKSTSNSSDWVVYHRSLSVPTNKALFLNTTAAESTSPYFPTAPTSTVFYTNGDGYDVNTTGQTYVAYLFAHDAGGFGLTGTDNVISCGSYVGDGSGDATVNLGWEPQFLLTKLAETFSEDWRIFDTMRGWDNSTSQGSAKQLVPNSSAAETTRGGWKPTATGFQVTSQSSGLKVIYIAIRRGPMKVPTSGTSVFSPVFQTGGGTVTTNFPVDLLISTTPSASSYRSVNDRLRGASTTRDVPLYTNVTDAEVVGTGYGFGFDNNTGFKDANYSSSFTDLYLNFRRAPSFFDEVCYTGTGSATTFSHNLQAVPEMMLIKRRNTTAQWQFYFAGLGNTKSVQMPDNDKVTSSGLFNNTSPTSSVFTVGVNSPVNASGGTYVAYLAATCAGVSKVGTYTGTGTTQQIDCGFAAGARFVLIKNVGVNDYAYGYYVWDTARGIVSGNDPYLLLNSTAAEVTNTDYIDTYSAGFEISSTAPAGINANGDQFVYWAIA
jgi:hypothetical protein